MNIGNRVALGTFLAANIVLFYAITVYHGDLEGLAQRVLDWPALIPAALLLTVVCVVNALFSSEMKARIVFLAWNNPLPGSRAFSKYGPEDPRVDMEALKGRFGVLPSEPRAQNVLWYRLFRSVNSQPSIQVAHRHYLLTRDCNVMSLLVLLGFGPVALSTSLASPALIYVIFLLGQFVLTGRSARTYGRRLVANVLAVCSTQ